MKLRLFYTRNGELKFISHLNTIDLLQRAVFNTAYQVAFSQGFNPHPIMSFGNPLPLGVSSDFEIFDVDLDEDKVDLDKFKNQLNAYLPDQVQVFKVFIADNTSISKVFSYSIYEFTLDSEKDLEKLNLFDNEPIIIERTKKIKKKREREVIQEDITGHVEIKANFKKLQTGEYFLEAKLENSNKKIINPMNFIQGLLKKYEILIDPEEIFIHKKEMI